MFFMNLQILKLLWGRMLFFSVLLLTNLYKLYSGRRMDPAHYQDHESVQQRMDGSCELLMQGRLMKVYTRVCMG